MRQSRGKSVALCALLVTLSVLLTAPASASALAPLNDSFEVATSLGSGRTASVVGTNAEGTAQTGEPRHFPYDPARTSVWYSWTAPSDGSLIIRTQSSFQPTIAAYTGATLGGLTRVANQAQARDGGSEAIRIRVQAGVTYRIAIDSLSVGGTFTISLELSDSPVNDDFDKALPLVGLAADVVGSTVAATQQPCEPVHDDNYYDPSVWYTWTAPASGGVTIDTTGSDFPTVLGIYTGDTLCNLRRVAVERLTGAGVPAKRTFRAVAGTTYRIAVDGAGGGMGSYKLSLRHKPPPANDLLANAEELLGTSPTATGTLFGATTESGEQDTGGSNGTSVWYSWTAPAGGTASVTLPSHAYGIGYGVYTGSAVGELKEVARGGYYPVNFRTVAGTKYLIVVHGGYTPSQGDFSLAVKHSPAPTNDDFAGALELSGQSAVHETSNVLATREESEPRTGYAYGNSSLWYSWTAPADGAVAIDTRGSTPETAAAAYTGDSLTALTSVANSSYNERFSFQVKAGTTYRIQVDSYASYSTGDIQLKLEFRPPPANDAFAAAVPLSPTATAAASGHTLGASAEAGEPSHYAYDSTRSSVWYSWVAPSDGALTINATSDFQPVLAAYTGSAIGSLTRVRNQPQDWNGGPEQIRVRVRAGTTYYIAVDATYGFPGTFSLSLTLVPHPQNDDFANAKPISGLVADVAGSTVGATQEDCEPVHDDNYYDPSVWFTWTAPESGAVTLDTLGSDFPTVLGVYTGDRLCSLLREPLRRMTQPGSVAKRGFRAVAGKTYRIAVDGQNAKMGNYKLSLRHKPPPANDLFENAQLIEGASALVDGTNFGATSEAPEPNSPTAATVWYSWTAPTTGLVKVEFPERDFDVRVAAYTGDTVDTRKLAASQHYYYGPLSFRATAGTTYHFAVEGPGATQGDFKLKLTSAAGPPNDDFANAAAMDGATGRVEGTTLGATSELGEPSHEYGDRRASAWYTWTAPETGLAVLNVASNQGANYVDAFTGDELGSLKRLNYGWYGVRFRAVKGTTYRIAVIGEDAVDRGAFALTWEIKPPPANDNFANAVELTGTNDNRTGTTVGAGSEEGEPKSSTSYYYYSDADATVWYTWKAPSSGLASVATNNGGVEVFRGEELSSLKLLAGGRYYDRAYFRAVEGETYRIRVANYLTSTEGAFSLSLMLSPPPANDDFANAAALDESSTKGTTLGATIEDGEPTPNGSRRGSVWYSWTPSTTGTAVLSLPQSQYYHSLSAYTGDSLDALERRGSQRYGALRFRVKAGTTYRIAVEADLSHAYGAFEVKAEVLPGPANDDFADAQELTGASATAEGSNVNATLEPFEPYRYSQGNSIWYRWTAPQNGRVTVDLSGSDFNTTVTAYSGSTLQELKQLAYDDDSGEGSTSRVSLPVRAGTTYYFSVDGYYGTTGAVKLALSHDPPPANDDFSASIELSGDSPTADGDTTSATHEAGEPVNQGYADRSRSVWYHWTAPRNGRATVDMAGTSFTPTVGIYEGTAVGALTRITSGYSYSAPVRLSFPARRGQTYRISVDGYYGQAGAFKLALTQEPSPANDDVADAQTIDGAKVSTTGTNGSATWEDGEPYSNGSAAASVWYRWTAPASGVVKIGASSSAFSPYVAAFSGTGFGSGSLAAGYNSIRFYANAGATYSIAVLGTYYGYSGGSFTLDLELASAPANDMFANAEELVGADVDVTGNTIAATQESCEPVHDDNYYDPSVWYSWKATVDGTVTLDTAGSDFNTVLGIYTGDALCSLQRVAVERLTGAGVPAKRSFRAVAGTTYRIALDGAGGQTGHFKLSLRLEPDAPAEPSQLRAAPDPPAPQDEGTQSTGGGAEAQVILPPEQPQQPADQQQPAAPPADPPAQQQPADEQRRSDSGPAAPNDPVPSSPPSQTAPNGPAPEQPFHVAFTARDQKLAAVIEKGLLVEVGCTVNCSFELSIAVDPGAAKKLSLRGSKMTVTRVSAMAGAGRTTKMKLKLPSAARKKLKKLAALKVTVTVAARSDGRTATATRQLTLKR